MNTIGFVISHKNNERRRALLPEHLSKIRHVEQLCFESGYGDAIHQPDAAYAAAGAHIVSRAQALECDVKLGDADFLSDVAPGKLLFGWAHAVQNTRFTDQAMRGGHTVLAWEEIYEGSRYLFYRNREIAGSAAILQAFLYCGRLPNDALVAIYGNGHTAKGALRILHGLGAEVDVYKWRQMEEFRRNIGRYDVLVNCCMWDTSRSDRLLYRSDLARMKRGAMIIDVSCDPELEIETSHPTTIDDPVYTVDHVLHYLPTYEKELAERALKRAEEDAAKEALRAAAAAMDEKRQNAEYSFSLGDKVQFGMETYTILGYDENTVILSDPKFPLLSENMPRDVFERRLRENPANDHLFKEVVEESPEETSPYLYAVDDVVYLDNKEFRITEVSEREVQLLDPTLVYPIFRAENKETFHHLLEQDDRNAKYFPDMPFTAITEPNLQEVAASEAVNESETSKLSERYSILIDGEHFSIWDEVENDFYLDEAGLAHHFRDMGMAESFLEELYRHIAEQEEAIEKPQYETETVAVYPAEQNKLPFDVVIQTLRTSEPEKPAPIQKHNFRISNDELGYGGPKSKFRMNMDAINTLQQLEFEKRLATPEEQETLSKYVGWGSLPQAFDENNPAWANEFQELYAALSPEEYQSARASVLNAHYTSPTVIKAIYSAIESMGFRMGNILEKTLTTLIQGNVSFKSGRKNRHSYSSVGKCANFAQ